MRRIESGLPSQASMAQPAASGVDSLLSLLSDDEEDEPGDAETDAAAADALLNDLRSDEEDEQYEPEFDELDRTSNRCQIAPEQVAPPPVQAPVRRREPAPAPANPLYAKATAKETFSGLALATRKVGDYQLRSTLERTGVRVLRLSTVPLQANAPGQWATIGVLSQMTRHEPSAAAAAAGGAAAAGHDKWVLTDLHPERPSTMSVCLTGVARDQARADAAIGRVYAVIGAKYLVPKHEGAQPVCVAGGGSKGGIMYIGDAAELGRCVISPISPYIATAPQSPGPWSYADLLVSRCSIRCCARVASSGSGGEDGGLGWLEGRCNKLIHRKCTDLCPVHLKSQRAPPVSLRLDLAGTSDPLPPPKRRKEDGPAPRVPAAAGYSSNPRAKPTGVGGGGLGGRISAGLIGSGLGGGRSALGAQQRKAGSSAGALASRPAVGEGPRESALAVQVGAGRAALAARAAPRPASAATTADTTTCCAQTCAQTVQPTAGAAPSADGSGGGAAAAAPSLVPAPAAVMPSVRAGTVDKKGEARAEFLKRSGASAGARNVVRMLAASEQREQQVAETRRLKQQQQQPPQQRRGGQSWKRPAVPPSDVAPPSWAAVNAPAQEQRAPQRAAAPAPVPLCDDDDDDDAGLELDFSGAKPAPDKHSWMGMARGGAERGGMGQGSGPAPSARKASGFFGLHGGDARSEELEKHIGVVAAGRGQTS